MKEGSYFAIRPGMAVIGDEGRIGSVSEVVGDTTVDIFRGIVVSHGLTSQHAFVDQAHVVAVVGDEVQVDLSADDLDALPDAPRIAQAS
jgi:hypothetical protein